MKQYNLAGAGSSIELGKQGPVIDGTNSSQVSLKDNQGNAQVAGIATGTSPSHGVTKAQFELELSQRVQTVNETVNYNSGTLFLFKVLANTVVLSVMVEKTAGNWVDYTSATEITVGDSVNNSRLFSGFEPDGTQNQDPTNYTYTTETDIFAYVTAGSASSGSARIRVTYVGNSPAQVQ